MTRSPNHPRRLALNVTAATILLSLTLLSGCAKIKTESRTTAGGFPLLYQYADRTNWTSQRSTTVGDCLPTLVYVEAAPNSKAAASRINCADGLDKWLDDPECSTGVSILRLPVLGTALLGWETYHNGRAERSQRGIRKRFSFLFFPIIIRQEDLTAQEEPK